MAGAAGNRRVTLLSSAKSGRWDALSSGGAMDIPYGVVGVINNSERAGHKVRVVDDAESTGGFLIYEWWTGSNGPNEAGAFDGWVEDEGTLSRYFEEAGWQVRWLV